MDDMNAFEHQVSRDALRDAGPSRSVDAAAVFARAVPAATAAPAWRFGSVFSATRFVVAGAIVALFGGLLLAGVLTQPSEEALPNVGASPSPEASSLPTVELPAVIPEDIESGVLDTPLGPARWIHLSGDAGTLPAILEPIPVPGGYVSLDQAQEATDCPQGQSSCLVPAELWFSPDLITWTRRPLPFVAASNDGFSLRATGGEYWLALEQAGSLWRSPDALEWEAVDLSGMEGPRSPEGIEWDSWLVPDAVAVSGDAVLVHQEYGPGISRSFLGLPEDRFPHEILNLERVDVGRYMVLESNPREWELGMLRLEETDGGLRVIDDETDAKLAVVEGVGLDSIDRWIDGWPEYRLALLHDGRLEAVELPDAGPTRFLTVLGTDDGFVANAVDPEGLIQTWTSPDGSSWTLAEPLGDDPGEPTANRWLGNGPDGLTVSTDLGEWASADGIEWQQLRGLPSESINRIGSSWVGLDGGKLLILSDDAEDYSVVGLSDLRLTLEPSGAGVSGTALIGANTIGHSVYQEASGGQADHWIITFDDVPASDAGSGQ